MTDQLRDGLEPTTAELAETVQDGIIDSTAFGQLGYASLRRTAAEARAALAELVSRLEQAEKERDRLAAALEQAERAIPKNADGSADCYDGSGNGVILGLARDTLASQEQT